jgi:hypothetical protein
VFQTFPNHKPVYILSYDYQCVTRIYDRLVRYFAPQTLTTRTGFHNASYINRGSRTSIHLLETPVIHKKCLQCPHYLIHNTRVTISTLKHRFSPEDSCHLGVPIRSVHFTLSALPTGYGSTRIPETCIANTITGWRCNNHLAKCESQWEGWHPIYYGKIKHVWNHQPAYMWRKKPVVAWDWNFDASPTQAHTRSTFCRTFWQCWHDHWLNSSPGFHAISMSENGSCASELGCNVGSPGHITSYRFGMSWNPEHTQT